MARSVLLGVAASLVGCGGPKPANDGGDQRQPVRSVGKETGGRLLDLADALTGEEEGRIAARLQSFQGARSGPVLIVLLKPEPGDSLERIGWAAGGGQKGVPLLVFADPEGAQVRIEGDLAPERRALVASAMRDQLQSGRTAEAVLAGIDRLEQVAR